MYWLARRQAVQLADARMATAESTCAVALFAKKLTDLLYRDFRCFVGRGTNGLNRIRKTDINLINISRSYRAVNRLHLGCNEKGDVRIS